MKSVILSLSTGSRQTVSKDQYYQFRSFDYAFILHSLLRRMKGMAVFDFYETIMVIYWQKIINDKEQNQIQS